MSSGFKNGDVFFNPTTNGIIGTNTNDNVSAGLVGEYIFSSVLGADEITLSSGTPHDITSIALTAGDWDVSGSIIFDVGGGTTSTNQSAWINTVSASGPTPGSGNNYTSFTVATSASQGFTLNVGVLRISVAVTTTVYLTAASTFAVSTMKAYGFIGARRVR